MQELDSVSSFFFVRHGQTDHNVNKVYDDVTDIPLNKDGIEQALALQEKLNQVPVTTVISSPLLRVQQTKNFIFGDRPFRDVVLEEFRECTGHLWRLFLEWEKRSLTKQEWGLIDPYLDRVKRGFDKSFQNEGPVAIVAHGGTFWALSHLLQLKIDRKIDNCVPVKFVAQKDLDWRVEFI